MRFLEFRMTMRRGHLDNPYGGKSITLAGSTQPQATGHSLRKGPLAQNPDLSALESPKPP